MARFDSLHNKNEHYYDSELDSKPIAMSSSWTAAAMHYKKEGDDHFRAGRHHEAISSWSRALQAPEVDVEVKATIYSNRCAMFLR